MSTDLACRPILTEAPAKTLFRVLPPGRSKLLSRLVIRSLKLFATSEALRLFKVLIALRHPVPDTSLSSTSSIPSFELQSWLWQRSSQSFPVLFSCADGRRIDPDKCHCIPMSSMLPRGRGDPVPCKRSSKRRSCEETINFSAYTY